MGAGYRPMADVFVNYSSKYRQLTEMLVALLKKEGYSVWGDFDLESWGSYQKQIDAKLAAAKVVVVSHLPSSLHNLGIRYSHTNRRKGALKESLA